MAETEQFNPAEQQAQNFDQKEKKKSKFAQRFAAMATAIGLAFSGGGGQEAKAAGNTDARPGTGVETSGEMPSQAAADEFLVTEDEEQAPVQPAAPESQDRQLFIEQLQADGLMEGNQIDPEAAVADFMGKIEVSGEQRAAIEQFLLSFFDAATHDPAFLYSNGGTEGRHLVDKIMEVIPASTQEQVLKISGDGSLGTESNLVRAEQQQDSGYWNMLNVGAFPAGVEITTDGHGNIPSGQLFTGHEPSLTTELSDIVYQLTQGQDHLVVDGEKKPYKGVSVAFTRFGASGEVTQQVLGTLTVNEAGKIVLTPTEVVGMVETTAAASESEARQSFIDALPTGGTAENNQMDPARAEADLASKIEFTGDYGPALKEFVTSFWDASVDEQLFSYSNANVEGPKLVDRTNVQIPASVDAQVLKISGDGSITVAGNDVRPEQQQDSGWWNTLSFAKVPAGLEMTTDGHGNIPSGQLFIDNREPSQVGEVSDIFRQLTEGQYHLVVDGEMKPYKGVSAVFVEFNPDGTIKTKVAGTFTLDQNTGKVVFNSTEAAGLNLGNN
ncbi:MAG: hypothetical protein Q4G02_03240 [bacterium]|nr:hypothetical protein [bacterium]